jgi:hypothetical protein
MRLKISVLSVFSLVFAVGAVGAASLPPVNVSRAVSARAMYGEIPVSKETNIARASIPTAAYQQPPTDVLTPRRPSGDLWATAKNDAPLRMPRVDEIAKLDEKFSLPEESLDAKVFELIARAKPTEKVAARKVENTNPSLVITAAAETPAPNTDALEKAYEAGRIAELQRIADRALADGGRKSTTRKLVVPMEDVSKPAVSSVRSVKSTPVIEEEFAYKDELPLTKLSPMELKRAFKKTYVSENKHLSTFQVND